MDVNNMKEINETNLNLNNNNNSTTLNNNNILNNITDDDNINLEFDNNLLLNSSMDGDQLEINSNDSLMSGDQPDPDYIKMFVGQVPKSMDEEQLKTMFEEYGRVHTINVLRDKVTGISKGCCFVTFYTRKAALKAQDALHNIKTLEGMHHPIQMKPADSENRNERKLFIGMLQKKLSENDVRKLFEGHGTIEECTVLRDQNGQSKGCAFVTFSTKQSAIAAIKTLHQSQTMEGCSAPVVVKFADTQKEKEQKKLQQMQANLWNLTAANINIPIPQVPQQIVTPMLANPQPKPNPIMTAQDVIAPSSLQLLQQLQSVGLHNQFLQAPQQQETHHNASASFLPQINVQNLTALAALTQQAPQPQPQPQPQLTNAATLLCLFGKMVNTGSDPTGLTNQYFPTSTFQQFSTPAQLNTAHLTSAHHLATHQNTMSSHLGKQMDNSLKRNVSTARTKQEIAQMILFSGPDGCNLFIYHLPQEFSDSDLASTFLPFGNVISAKVFIDKQTNLSKCFGFVSFDNPESAQAAIKAMHGFQIGTKRLKVQLKKPKDASKPY